MAYKTLGDLDNIISVLNTLSNQAQKKEQRRYSRDASQYDVFASDLDTTYSNDRLNVLESRVDDYINTSGGQFNDLSIENFSLLKQKIQYQREDNAAYEAGYDKLEKYTETNYKFIDDFKTVQGLVPDADGFIEFDVDGDGTMKKIRKDDWLIQQKEYMQNHVRSYLDAQDNFSLQFGGEKGRLTNLSQREKLIRINNFDEVFRFGIDSIADEFLDDAEYEAYTNAFLYKDKKYIDEFETIRKGQQSSIRTYHEKEALEVFKTVNYNLRAVRELDMLQDLTDKVNGQGAYVNISHEDRRIAQRKLADLKLTPFPIEQKGGQPVTYGELISDSDTIDKTSGLFTTLKEMQRENNRLATEMGKRNKVYMQSSEGQSLGDLGLSFNDDSLSALAGFKIKSITPKTKEEFKQEAIASGEETFIYDGVTYNVEKAKEPQTIKSYQPSSAKGSLFLEQWNDSETGFKASSGNQSSIVKEIFHNNALNFALGEIEPKTKFMDTEATYRILVNNPEYKNLNLSTEQRLKIKGDFIALVLDSVKDKTDKEIQEEHVLTTVDFQNELIEKMITEVFSKYKTGPEDGIDITPNVTPSKPYNTKVVDLGESSEAQSEYNSWIAENFPDSRGILPEPINIDKELSLLTVDYPSAKNKVKEWGVEYNKLHEFYRDFSMDADIELKSPLHKKKWNFQLAPLNNILERDEKTPLTKEDVVELRKTYDNDMAEIEKLKSHKKWLKSNGKFGIRITSALGWEDDINKITNMYKEIERKWRYDEDGRGAEDFLEYIENKITRTAASLFEKHQQFKNKIGQLQK